MVGQWKAGCAVQHNMYVCVDNCYCCYYELAKLLKCIVVLGYILTFTYSTFLGKPPRWTDANESMSGFIGDQPYSIMKYKSKLDSY